MSYALDVQPGECAETSGFLFSHKCGEAATTKCSQCQKFICLRHTITDEQRSLCTTCAKGLPNTRSSSRYDDDPYFYSDVYYPGYHHFGYGLGRSSDFTDGDEQALGDKEPELKDVKAFENNMGAS